MSAAARECWPASCASGFPLVTGVDLDEASIVAARAHGDDIAYLLGDAMTEPLAAESFDVVTCVAVLHHLGTERGLTRLASLVAPGGVLGVVGLGCAVDPGCAVGPRGLHADEGARGASRPVGTCRADRDARRIKRTGPQHQPTRLAGRAVPAAPVVPPHDRVAQVRQLIWVASSCRGGRRRS